MALQNHCVQFPARSAGVVIAGKPQRHKLSLNRPETPYPLRVLPFGMRQRSLVSLQFVRWQTWAKWRHALVNLCLKAERGHPRAFSRLNGADRLNKASRQCAINVHVRDNTQRAIGRSRGRRGSVDRRILHLGRAGNRACNRNCADVGAILVRDLDSLAALAGGEAVALVGDRVNRQHR